MHRRSGVVAALALALTIILLIVGPHHVSPVLASQQALPAVATPAMPTSTASSDQNAGLLSRVWDQKPPTTYEWLSIFISFLGFGFVIVSLRALTNQTRVMSFDGIHSLILSSDEMFVQHPDMRKYFYENVDISTDDPDYNLSLAMAETLLDTFESYIHHNTYVRYYRGVWKEYIVDAFQNSPILRARFDQTPDWYPPDLQRLRNEAQQRIDEKQKLQAKDG
jgi:hypothetical protein